MKQAPEQEDPLRQQATHIATTYRIGRIPPEIANYLLEVYSNTANVNRNVGLEMSPHRQALRNILYSQICANKCLRTYLETLQAEQDTRAEIRNTVMHLDALQEHVTDLHTLEAEINAIRTEQSRMMGDIAHAISQGYFTEEGMQQMVQDMYLSEDLPLEAMSERYSQNPHQERATPFPRTLDEKIAAWQRVPNAPNARSRIASLTYTQAQIQQYPMLKNWVTYYHQAFYELERQVSLKEAQLQYKAHKPPQHHPRPKRV